MRIAYVAPRVGAWIETLQRRFKNRKIESHPVWVRGLKQNLIFLDQPYMLSHPVWVRGLKLQPTGISSNRIVSHPVWVRGLKR